jgi:hypothetical protein
MICHDCHDITSDYYMVHDWIWYHVGVGDGYLCIACLERRLGRELTADDLTDALVNRGWMSRQDRYALRKLLNRKQDQ